jgi:uncharacterized phage protein (TIGR02218 family)
MKVSSTAARAILAGGQFYKAELYTFTLAGGSTYRFTTSQVPIKVGGNPYGTGLIIKRGTVTQRVGLEVQSLQLRISPQSDYPAGPVTIGGVPFLQAVRAGVFDAARVLMEKIFLTSWDDTSPGAVSWAQGRSNEIQAGRMESNFSVNDDTELLNVAMPRNIIQAGCVHALYDAGCTLLKSTFRQSGTISGTPTVFGFTTNLTRADNYFNLGVLTFTSGVNNGISYVVKTYLNTGGAVAFIRPTAAAASASDTFTIVPACPKTQAACSNTNVANGPAFNNLSHFRGHPYVPTPETLYSGGTSTSEVPTLGGQGGAGGGSTFTGGAGRHDSYDP